MKRLLIKLAIPLTVISFAVFTKWWYALPVDAPDSVLTGFPLPFVCEGWHTSGSLQIFITELLFDLLVYFLFWFIVIYLINNFLTKISIHKAFVIFLYGISGIILVAFFLIASNSDNRYALKRNFNMDVLDTGYTFIWQNQTRPVLNEYIPEHKNE